MLTIVSIWTIIYRVFVEPATQSNHAFNSEGIGLDTRATAKQALSIASRDYFSMDIDVPGNFTYNIGDLVWCEVPVQYNLLNKQMTLKLNVMML